MNSTYRFYNGLHFLNGNPSCHQEHCFDFGKKKPLVPQVGARVTLDYIIDDYYPDDTYDDMHEHWYEVVGITYCMDNIEDYPVVTIDIEAIDATDEVMEECEWGDECGCCPHCGGDCCWRHRLEI